jgi:MFS family permease
METSIKKFNDWGWRIPFWVSIVLVGVSIYIRLKMKESPLFAKLKAEGKTVANPLKESFTHKANLKMVLLALFGATMGQGVVWYTGQFYAQSFIENACQVDFEQSRTILIWAILFATPFFILFGWWSDKIGRKWIMMVGMLLAVVTYRPLFNELLHTSDVSKLKELTDKKEIRNNLRSIPETANSVRNITTKRFFEEGMIRIESRIDTVYAGGHPGSKAIIKNTTILNGAGYWKMVLIVFVMIFYVTMVYGPIAAFLVELFPTKIRYTSMSLPYHIGNGVFGGLTPFIALLLTTIYTGNKLVGLWYPIIIASICFVIGAVYIRNKIDPDVND